MRNSHCGLSKLLLPHWMGFTPPLDNAFWRVNLAALAKIKFNYTAALSQEAAKRQPIAWNAELNS